VSGDHSGSPGDEHTSASGAVAARVRHVEALLEQRGLVDPVELDRALTAFLAGGSPASGARVVARAWVDDGFRQRLLADANAALPEIGLSMGGGLQEQRLKVVENTATTHNVIVCTLCSCYPIALLGPSPTWYKSEGYRSRVVRDPRAVLREFGYDVPADVEIDVWDASAESRHMVLPRRPEATGDLTEEQLAGLVTRNGLIGVAPV
jgi:nitrile hydratase